MIEINTWCKFQVSLGYNFGNLIFHILIDTRLHSWNLFLYKSKRMSILARMTEKDHHSFFSDASLWNLKYNSCTCTSGTVFILVTFLILTKKIQKYNHPCKKENLIQSTEKMKFSQCWYTFFYVLEIKNSIYFLTENL